MDADAVFRQLKPVCVAIFGQSLLTPTTASSTSDLLSRLLRTLKELPDPATLTPPLINYVFQPLSMLLTRNPMHQIPNHVLEKIFQIMAILFDRWWWDCDIAIWEQLLMLSASILGGLDMKTAKKGKENQRDDETKESVVQCSLSLLRERSAEEAISYGHDAHTRLLVFQEKAATLPFFPILGQLLDGLLGCSESQTLSLQLCSLRVVEMLVHLYIPLGRLPSVLPGVVSTSCKVALGTRLGRGWQSAKIVEAALELLGTSIIKGCGDDVCLAEGVVRKPASDLEDLLDLTQPSSQAIKSRDEADRYATPRTAAWLQATSSQVHMALNTLSPLLSHPTPSVLVAMARLSSLVLRKATLTLQTIHPLLISRLLTLSTSPFPDTADISNRALKLLLSSPSEMATEYTNMVLQAAQRNLSSLPRFILTHSEAHIERACKEIIAICRLSSGIVAISKSIQKILGPSGGIEKWATPLLQVLKFDIQALTVAESSPFTGLIMDSLQPASSPSFPFPRLTLHRLESDTAQNSLEEMFFALGSTGGKSTLYCVEWLVDLARDARGLREVSALWCAVKLLEGVGDVTIADGGTEYRSQYRETYDNETTKRRRAVAKYLTKTAASLWDIYPYDSVPGTKESPKPSANDGSTALNPIEDALLPTQHIKGLSPITTLLDGNRNQQTGQTSDNMNNSPNHARNTAATHSILCLRLIAICASILGSEFNPLLIYSIYPILRSMVSSHQKLSSAAISTLHHVSYAAAYASPSNLLLSNFDYALDAVSRRLLRTQLDIKATKVLVVLVRLVGRDVVQRAGDVVEECFDRLDEYHGYGVIVEGLVEVLSEVVQAAEFQESREDDTATDVDAQRSSALSDPDTTAFSDLLNWMDSRRGEETPQDEGFGPVPHRPWGQDPQSEPEHGENVESASPNRGMTTTQALVALIFHRSIPLITDSSPFIRRHILLLMSRSISIAPPTSLLPSIHRAWPFILNRLKDAKVFVTAAASALINNLLRFTDDFMNARFWDDVWPVYKDILTSLEAADREHALLKRGHGAVGTSTAYSTSHELYLSILDALASAFPEIPEAISSVKDELLWEVTCLCRRFLSSGAHPELQATAKRLYIKIGRQNADLVWLILYSTVSKKASFHLGCEVEPLSFLREDAWDLSSCFLEISASLENI